MSLEIDQLIARRLIEEHEIETLQRRFQITQTQLRATEAEYIMAYSKALIKKPTLKLSEFKLMVEALLTFTDQADTKENVRRVANRMIEGL